MALGYKYATNSKNLLCFSTKLLKAFPAANLYATKIVPINGNIATAENIIA